MDQTAIGITAIICGAVVLIVFLVCITTLVYDRFTNNEQVPNHRARPASPWLISVLLFCVFVGVACALSFFAGARTIPPREVRTTTTVTEPGPTTTISYLIEVTVTPGRNGF